MKGNKKMATNQAKLGTSAALGFWARHPEIVDELYELESADDYLADDETLRGALPKELAEFASSNRDLLEQIMCEGESDIGRMQDWLKAAVSKRVQEFCKVMASKTSSPWAGKVRVEHSDGRSAKALRPMEFGWSVWTESNQLSLETWIWVPSGRRIERNLFEYLKCEVPNPQALLPAERRKGYQIGVVRLSKMPMLVGDDFCLDLDCLASDALESFDWITRVRMNGLFELQRSK